MTTYNVLRYGQTATFNDTDGGIDTVYFDQTKWSPTKYSITQGEGGAILVDSVGSASSYHLTLYNIEKLSFDNGKTIIDLTTYFADTSPTVSSITYGTNDGQLASSEAMTLVVTFSKTVNVTGTPNIALANGGTAIYTSGTGSKVLTFTYTPSIGQNTSDLSTATSNALTGTIKDAAGNSVTASGFNNVNPTGVVIVDVTAPTASSIAYGSSVNGDAITLIVTLSDAVNVTGTPSIALANGGSATYSSGTGSNTLTFTYTPSIGQDTSNLATASNNALSGTIKDVAGNNVTLTSFNNVNLTLDDTKPTLSSATPADGATSIATNSDIVLHFSEAVRAGTGLIEIHAGSASGTLIASYNVATDTTHLTFSGSTLTINPQANLSGDTHYFVVVPSGAVIDALGNTYDGTSTYDFTTALVPPINFTGTVGIDNPTCDQNDDTLTGLGGVDILNGKDGSDLYVMTATLDHTAAEINDTGNIGTDEVRFTSTTAKQTLTLFAGDRGIEKVTIGTGTGVNPVTSSTTPLNVNAAAVTNALHMSGNNGINILTGTAFNDTLDGGLGIDTLIGGAGNDTYLVDLVTTKGALEDKVTELANGGTDTLSLRGTSTNAVAATLILASTLEHLDASATGSSKLNLTGNTTANTLTGNAANNIINGLVGADTLIGGAGDDTYVVDNLGDVVTENSNEGADLVQVAIATANGSFTLGAHIENGTLTNKVAFSLIGNNLNNTLNGNTLANTLTGGEGDDTLNGLAGADTMIGETGSDTYVVDNVGDIAIESTGDSGTDLVQSSVTYSLNTVNAAGVENLTLTGTAAINGTGNALNNTMTGNAGINILNGGEGNDNFIGGLGNDNLTGGSGADVFVFNTALNAIKNRDTITDFVSGTDKIHLENSIMTALGLDTGALTTDQFFASPTAVRGNDANDRIVYNTNTGALYYDADGSGAGAAVQFALIGTTTHPSLTNEDFWIV